MDEKESFIATFVFRCGNRFLPEERCNGALYTGDARPLSRA